MDLNYFFSVGFSSYALVGCAVTSLALTVTLWAVRPLRRAQSLASGGLALGIAAIGGGRAPL